MYHDWNNSIAVLKMLITEKSRNHGADNTVNKFSELSVADAATPSLPREPSQRSSMGTSLFSEKTRPTRLCKSCLGACPRSTL